MTLRQAEVLELLARGMTAQQAAEQLFIAETTVVGHIRVMRDRAAVTNAPELVARAFVAGILLPSSWPPRLSGRRCLQPEPSPSN